MNGPVRVVLFDLGDTLVAEGRRWVAGAESVLATLRAQGLLLGVVSNTAHLTRAQLLASLPETFDFALFDAALVILSSEVGFEKPDPAIFRLAIARAGVPASEILFCTESPLHVLVAQQVGLMALRTLPPPNGDVKEVPALLQQLGG